MGGGVVIAVWLLILQPDNPISQKCSLLMAAGKPMKRWAAICFSPVLQHRQKFQATFYDPSTTHNLGRYFLFVFVYLCILFITIIISDQYAMNSEGGDGKQDGDTLVVLQSWEAAILTLTDSLSAFVHLCFCVFLYLCNCVFVHSYLYLRIWHSYLYLHIWIFHLFNVDLPWFSFCNRVCIIFSFWD